MEIITENKILDDNGNKIHAGDLLKVTVLADDILQITFTEYDRSGPDHLLHGSHNGEPLSLRLADIGGIEIVESETRRKTGRTTTPASPITPTGLMKLKFDFATNRMKLFDDSGLEIEEGDLIEVQATTGEVDVYIFYAIGYEPNDGPYGIKVMHGERHCAVHFTEIARLNFIERAEEKPIPTNSNIPW